ncbi:flagellin N-terminal helical domain-containing protein [Azospirillum argentinense]
MISPDLQLPAAMRANLLTLQVTQQGMSAAQQRLATGLKINAALDSPPVYFAAKALTQRAADLSAVKDAIGQAISTVKAGDKGVSGIGSLLQQARGLTTAALTSLGSDPAAIRTRAALAAQFDAILGQINGVAHDSGYGGKNLLVGDGSGMEATVESKLDVQRIVGVTKARVTDITAPDSYDIRVVGDGEISGAAEGIADAEQQLGLTGLSVSGLMSSTQGNFNNIQIAVTGSPGRDKTITVSNPPESYTQKFTVDEWKAAETVGTPLSFDHAFQSGSRVRFDVDFDLIDATPRNVGTRSVEIEKHAALAVKVTNNQGLTVTRDLMSPLGQGKLANGVNDFVFPSGTVRIEVDGQKLCSRTDPFARGTQIGVDDLRGTGPYLPVGVPVAQAEQYLSVPESTYFRFKLGLPDGNSPGLRDLYVWDTRYDSVTQVSVPNERQAYFPVTLAGNNPNAGSTIRLNIDAFDPASPYAFDFGIPSPVTEGTPGWVGVTDAQPHSTGWVGIATNSPILDGMGGIPPFADNVSNMASSAKQGVYNLVPESIQGFVPGANARLRFQEGLLDSAGPGQATLTVTDDLGRSFQAAVPNAGFTYVDVNFAETDASPASSMRVGVVSRLGTGFGQTLTPFWHDVEIKWPAGTRESASLKTALVEPANHANDMFVAFDTSHTNGVTVESQNLQVEGKGLHVDYSQNGWMDRADIDNAIKGLDTAEQRLRSATQVLTNGMGIITTREDFMRGLSDVLDEGANKLILADQNEEGTNLLTLQTRKQLAQTALGLAKQSQQAILSLFR